MIERLARFHDRTMATFFLDDCCGHEPADAEAFLRFSGWVEQNGLKGECSAILAYKRTEDGRPLPLQKTYAKEVERASRKHLDAHMEVMTHRYLFDFATGRMRGGGSHEGVWLMDRNRTFEEYCEYLDGIAKTAAHAGFRHSGLTLPGCGCEPCLTLKRGLVIKSPQAADLNRNLLRALLQMAKDNRLATPVCSLFVGKYYQGPMDVQMMLEDGPNAVYDVPPGVGGDTLARWDNLPEYLDLDQYITADGTKGRLVELIALQSATMGFYGHWQAIRPDTGIGYAAFQELGRRVNRFHGEHVEWMRPTEIAMYRQTERHTQVRIDDDRRGFALSIPFPPLHPVSFRLRGDANARLKTPSGLEIRPWKSFPGEACAIFDVMPENGRYEIL
jgi:hypothetical protein